MPSLLLVLLSVTFLGGNILRWQFGSGYAISALDVSITLSVAWYVCTQWKKTRRNPLFIPFSLLIATFLFSLIGSIGYYTQSQFFVSISYTFRFFIIGLLLFLPKEKERLWALQSMGGGTVSLALFQYFFYPSLRNLYYLGWDEHLYRAFGQFLDPNFLGIYLGMYLLFLIHTYFNVVHPSKKRQGLIMSMIFLTITALFLTYSRESYIVTFLGVVIFSVRKKILTIKNIFFIISICCILFIGYIFLAHKSEGTKLFRTASIWQRLESDQKALIVFTQHPLLGIGFNSYSFYHPISTLTETVTAYPNHAASAPENSYLLVLATTGIIGLSIYLYFWWCVIQYTAHDPLVMSTIILFLASGLFINSLFYPLLLVWFFLLV